jgi:hypothetical protein
MSGSMSPRGIPPTPMRRDARQVRRWRRQRLMAAGYDELAALRLARCDVDVHALLVQQESCGVPPVLDDGRRRRHG